MNYITNTQEKNNLASFYKLAKASTAKSHASIDTIYNAYNYINDHTIFNCGNILNNDINEFRSIVLKRRTDKIYHKNLQANHTIKAVNEVISPFFADAVKTTLSFLISGTDKSVTIKSYSTDSNIDTEFYQQTSKLLSGELLVNHTNFYTCFAQVVESYYQYGIGILLLSDLDDKKSFYCSALDLINVKYIKDNRNNLIGITYTTENTINEETYTKKFIYVKQLSKAYSATNDTYPEMEAYSDDWLEISCFDNARYEREILNYRIIPYQPIHILLTRPVAGQEFKEGVGLSLLTEIKNYNNIYNAYINSVSVSSKTIIVQNNGVQYGNKESSIQFSSKDENLGLTRMEISGASTDTPLNNIIAQIPIQHRHEPLERLLQALITRMREQFPFITRFLNLIGNNTLTATEAKIRDNADLGKLRDDTDYFYRTFLENLNISQLIIFDKYKRLKSLNGKTTKNYLKDIVFSYDSLYKRQEKTYNEDQVLQFTTTISNILDLQNKDLQINQGQLTLNYAALIAKVTELSGQDTMLTQTPTLQSLQDIFNNPQLAQQEATKVQDEINNY